MFEQCLISTKLWISQIIRILQEDNNLKHCSNKCQEKKIIKFHCVFSHSSRSSFRNGHLLLNPYFRCCRSKQECEVKLKTFSQIFKPNDESKNKNHLRRQ